MEDVQSPTESSAWKELSALCRLPHRGSTTDGERRAADWIAKRMERLGYTVSRQSFLAPRATLYTGPSIVLGIVAASAGAGLLFSDLPPWVTLLMALVATLPLVGELLGWRRLNLDLLLAKHPSQNVIGCEEDEPLSRKPPQGLRPIPNEHPDKQIIVVAHYDTQLGSPLFAPRLVRGLTPFFTLAYVAVGALLLIMATETATAWLMGTGASVAVWRQPGWLWTVRLGFSMVALLCAVWLLLCRTLSRPVNGANDNGSGVALALALAGRLKEEGPIPGARVAFAFTGSEEVGERGMRYFVDRLPTAPDGPACSSKPIVINLDNMGAGKMRFLTGEGMLRYYPYDAELLAAARQVSERHPEGTLSAWRNLPLPTDGLMSVTKGLPTITFIAIRDDGRIPNYHWHTDRLDGVDPELVTREADILWEYMWAVAAPEQYRRLTALATVWAKEGSP